MEIEEDELEMGPDPLDETEENEYSGIVDTHVHFWKYNKKRDAWMDDMKVLQKDYVPAQFIQTAKRNDVSGIVAIQADQSELETHFLVELAKSNPIIKGVVG